MYKGSMTFETPMLFAGRLHLRLHDGRLTGLILAMARSTSQLQDSYYVVAHFHYVLVAGSLFALFAGTYYWLPEVDRPHVQRGARQVALLAVDDLLQHHVLPMHFLGLAGMPRRYADYPLQFADFNLMASIGAFGFGFTQLLFLYIVVKCIKVGEGCGESVGAEDGVSSGRCRHLRRSTRSRRPRSSSKWQT